MIEFEHVSKIFDGVKAVDDLTLSIPKGAFCALIASQSPGDPALSWRAITRRTSPSASSRSPRASPRWWPPT